MDLLQCLKGVKLSSEVEDRNSKSKLKQKCEAKLRESHIAHCNDHHDSLSVQIEV